MHLNDYGLTPVGKTTTGKTKTPARARTTSRALPTVTPLRRVPTVTAAAARPAREVITSRRPAPATRRPRPEESRRPARETSPSVAVPGGSVTTPIRDDYQPIRDDYQDEYYDDGTVTNNTPVEVQGEQLLIVGDKGYGVTVKKPASTLLPLLLGGGAGFLVGGPLGAAVGAAGAALLGGKKTAVVPTDNVDEVEVAPEAAPVYEEQESSTGWEWADDRNAAQDFGAVDPVEREKARQAREAARSTTPKLIGRNTAAATRRPSSEAKNREAAKREDASKSFVTAPVAAGGAALLWLLLR